MRQMERIASRVPYMVAPGNHEYMPLIGCVVPIGYPFGCTATEIALILKLINANHVPPTGHTSDDGVNYRNRFQMPGPHRNDMYTFAVGQIRYVVLNSEVYFSKLFTAQDRQEQHRFLVEQLQLANQRRSAQPWLIVLLHRPLYCSGTAWRGRRAGASRLLRTHLEEAVHRHGVDLVIVGHNHHYERSHPVHQKRVHGDRSLTIVRNPTASVYIVNGAAVRQRASRYLKYSYFNSIIITPNQTFGTPTANQGNHEGLNRFSSQAPGERNRLHRVISQFRNQKITKLSP